MLLPMLRPYLVTHRAPLTGYAISARIRLPAMLYKTG